MASISATHIRLRLETKNVNQALTTISALTSKLDRVVQLFSEIRTAIIDLENDLNNIELNIVEEKENENERLGREEASAS